MYTYGYAVYTNGNTPLFIIETHHCMYAGFSVFNKAWDALAYITKEKESLSAFGELKYDPDFQFSRSLISLYTDSPFGLFSKISNRQVYRTRC